MKLTAFILLLLFFVQSYFFYEQFKKKISIGKKYEDAVLAIQYHEKKNLLIVKQLEDAESKNVELYTELTNSKIDRTKRNTNTNQLKQTIRQLEKKINRQATLIQQKENEILILKNELLKYIKN